MDLMKKLFLRAQFHPETGVCVSNCIQKGWLVSRLLCRVAVSREMKEQRWVFPLYPYQDINGCDGGKSLK